MSVIFAWILQDLLASLNETKASSAAIFGSLSESSRLQAELNKECDVYQPLAEFGSTLYFIIMDLGKVNNMYQFSVNAFMRLFQKALSGPQVINCIYYLSIWMWRNGLFILWP
jgi:dynein heavy chain 2